MDKYDDTEVETDESSVGSQQLHPKHKILSGFITFALLSCTLWFTWEVIKHNPRYLDPPQVSDSQVIGTSDCGNTSTEAAARGCQFDFIRLAWIPETCFDQELNEEYVMQMRQWMYYFSARLNGTELTLEDIRHRSVGDIFYSTYREHFAHCAYAVLATQREFRAGHGFLYTPTHNRHCFELLLNESVRDSARESHYLDSVAFANEVTIWPC